MRRPAPGACPSASPAPGSSAAWRRRMGRALAAACAAAARAGFNLVLGTPWLMRCVMALGGVGSRRFPERMFAQVRALAPPIDQPILDRPEVADCLTAGLREAFRPGRAGCGGRAAAAHAALDLPSRAHPRPGASLAWRGRRRGAGRHGPLSRLGDTALSCRVHSRRRPLSRVRPHRPFLDAMIE